ncbi:maleylpyruvate isomerase family mycothiol-dependent enzyme [Tsukamurella sp. 8F]|uniref:maleylpyruvate isomerase family mycothiol-dependent enzyme n=1 Tax=unclassified Tsukamurella TaxID=2633480 RepID=UPI0023BA01E2|nr:MULTISPECIES: maleylpyruvate isomerase family mycothiol-dependent enzyme [unclassified Tsukamurella]MDF0530349.1 maleylpyruvate isomerase family mycothiol-dependent enzyme [Tsukamurella sp. 8J]MDF0587646.1 maleylpyruvate isomerase family mycothiol-dependent enzyme [Tsukamurella sp. 8F]
MPSTELSALVETWWRSAQDLVALLDDLPESDFARPTDLAGWDVRAVAGHVAHLESILVGGPHETADVPSAPHITGPMSAFTEIGVLNRRDHTGAEIAREIGEITARRHAALLADPPGDPDAPAPGVFGALGWSMRTLLRNRPLDVWMHEQDIRRAVGRPGGMDTPPARHVVEYLSESLGFVLGKKCDLTPGTTVTLDVDGHVTTATVDDAGRGRLLPEPPAGGLRITTDRESFILRAGGRREVPMDRFAVVGDHDLATRIVAALAVTP